MDTSLIESFAGKAIEWLESAAGFAAKEIPLYIQEVLVWKASTAIFYIILNVAMILVFLIFSLRVKNLIFSRWEDVPSEKENFFTVYWVLWVILAIAAITHICFLPGNILDLIQIQVAPRVYLVEYFQKLL